MLGYWVDRSPLKTNKENIKSTIYLNPDKALIAIGSWSGKDENVQLEIDWGKLDFDETTMQLSSPKIEGLQEYRTFDFNKPVPVEKNQGLILILEKKQ